MGKMPIDAETARQQVEEAGLKAFVLVGCDRDGEIKFVTSHADLVQLLDLAELVKLQIAEAMQFR